MTKTTKIVLWVIGVILFIGGITALGIYLNNRSKRKKLIDFLSAYASTSNLPKLSQMSTKEISNLYDFIFNYSKNGISPDKNSTLYLAVKAMSLKYQWPNLIFPISVSGQSAQDATMPFFN
jgi:hypothetical protein